MICKLNLLLENDYKPVYDENGEAIYKKEKMTANQFAKMAIVKSFDNLDFWNEIYEDEFNMMTEKEREQVNEQMQKRINGIKKYLGL